MANDIQEELGDLSNTMFGDGLKSCSTSPLEGGLLGDPDACGICMNKLLIPRVLSCLHVFCEQCLDNKIIGEAGDAGKPDTVITCPTCKQDTRIGPKKVASLPLDVITTNVIDVSNMANLTCTCCTTKEVAVSRCCTCHNLLCGNCNSAHQFMRCFEKHKVIMLEELKVSGKKIPIHKTLMCETHSAEALSCYCVTCQQLVCGECSKTDHRTPLHHCDTITDAETHVKQELEGLLSEGKSKVDVLLQASTDLEGSLGELAHQRSTAKDLINESYQSYKAVLERCRDDALAELNELYHERELKLMDMTHRVGKDATLVEDACKFTSRLLENGNIMEIMYLKKCVSTQLLNLINNTPKPEKTFSIEFETDMDKFERIVKNVFGYFTTESSTPKTSSPLSVVMPVAITMNGTGGGINLTNGCPSLNNSSPISLPTSMQSSFDGDIQSNLPGFALTQTVLSPDSPSANAIPGFTSIAEYNLQQLASLAEKVDLGDAVIGIGGHSHGAANPSTAPSPTPSFTLADLLTGDPNTVNTAYHNLQALAKLGLNSTDTSNGGIVLGRGTSPGLEGNTLTLSNPILNGFSSMSNSTSPILSTPEDILPDGLHAVTNSSNASVNNSVVRTNKVSPMQIRCKFGQLGPSKGQFNSPHGFCLGTEEDIIVADTNNHRIQIFDKTGNYKFQFGIPGKDEGQLWYPRKVAVMRNNGKYVVCDRGNERSRMQIFTKNGHFIKKIAIRYIDIVAGLAVTQQGEIVAVDSVSPTVFVISENGDLLRWFDCSDYMREPSDIAIHGKEYYVCDFKGHNVVVFSEQGEFLRRIGCENITNFPNGIDISDAGDILIGDSHGNRFHVAVFARDGSLVTEFECPYVKVSRCCGLKITSEGYVVTLAKNNHHVLVLNTLYIL